MYLLQTWQISRRMTVTIDVPLSHCNESQFASKECNKTFFPYLLKLWPFVWPFDDSNSTTQEFKSYTLHLRPLIKLYNEHAYFNTLTICSFTLTHCKSCYWCLKLTSTWCSESSKRPILNKYSITMLQYQLCFMSWGHLVSLQANAGVQSP
jgi:hypothetical protein